MSNQNDDHQSDFEIEITLDDLESVQEQQRNVTSFFADPSPKPVTPTALVEAKCIKRKRPFYFAFEQVDKNTWAIRYVLDESFGAIAPSSSAAVTIEKDLVAGKIDWSALASGEVACPHCGTHSCVKCGKCKRLSCHVDGQSGSHFSCAWCDNSGTLSGYIKSLSGASGKGKNK